MSNDRKVAWTYSTGVRVSVTWAVLCVLSFVLGVVVDVHTGNSALIVASFAGLGLAVVALCGHALFLAWRRRPN